MSAKHVDLPRWGKVYDLLRSRIASGSYHSALTIDIEQFRSSYDETTLNTALDFLEAEGLVTKKDGEIYQKKQPARSRRMSSFEKDYKDAGRKPISKKIDLRLCPINTLAFNIKREFQSDEQFVINYKTIQIVDDIPHAISESYIPYSYFSGLYEKLNEKHVSLYDFFENNGYRPTHKKEVLRVDAPSIEERMHLNIVDANRVNVVRIQGYVYSGDVLVELCLLCDRSDLYEFHYEIKM